MTNTLDGINDRLDTAKEKISRLQDIMKRHYQNETERKTQWNKNKWTQHQWLKKKMVISTEEEKAFNKIQHPILIKTPAKQDKKGTSSTCKRHLPKQSNKNYS